MGTQTIKRLFLGQFMELFIIFCGIPSVVVWVRKKMSSRCEVRITPPEIKVAVGGKSQTSIHPGDCSWSEIVIKITRNVPTGPNTSKSWLFHVR